MDLIGLPTGDPRLPLVPVTRESRDGMKRVLTELGLL